MLNPEQFSLNDKYIKKEGTILLSGIQALVRLPVDQHEADLKAGLKTATFISGYRGSPLGGLDIVLKQNEKWLQENDVKFMPGVNEDLGATAVFGSQIANLLPQPKFDGVLGMWYGKAPGVDRSGDIFKHANTAGTGKYGGVLAIAGDDPISKSSTLPSHSEVAFYDAMMPVLYPGNIQEILTYGRLGFELSRYSGLWVGFKIVTDLADGFGTANITPIENVVKPYFEYNGKPWEPTQNPTLLPIFALQLEKELVEGRLKAATLFASTNNLNEITVSSDHDSIGIIAAGKTYYDVKESLYLLGLSDERLKELGIRLLKLGMIYPLEPTILNEFSFNLEEIIIIEEKRGFIEMQIRSSLYNNTEKPLIVGKENEDGTPLFPKNGELVVKDILPRLIKRLERFLPADTMELFDKREKNTFLMLPTNQTSQQIVQRTPYFCSGCPHNTSTVVPEGSLSGGGIGCHGLVLAMNRQTIGLLHMGGEGIPWVGAAPFSSTNHMFQNLGDGTLFHSGTLAIRQAIASKQNITYKILYNSVVAMTGGQPADGELSVPDLTRLLEAEGVSKIIVCADDPKKYPRRSKWAKGVNVWHRDKIDKAQEILRDMPGTTILIYDQPCAADMRRKRSRNLAPTPPRQIFINESVCEGCGDCGVKSNCLSVFPVETEFGRKTQIHQSSCNRDYTCLKGDCPAFVSVEVKNGNKSFVKKVNSDILDLPVPKPEQKVPDNTSIFMVGIGGTGVVTVSQIVATAAVLDGKYTTSLDQTGLSQKGGPVSSHIKILSSNVDVSNKTAYGGADAFLAFDILNAVTDANLLYTDPTKTIAIASLSKIPTGSMVSNTQVLYPNEKLLFDRLQMNTRAQDNTTLDAVSLAENLFGSHMPANMIVLGAAYQAGAIPLSLDSIFHAIELNGVAVEANKQAFTVGRLSVDDANDWLKTVSTHRIGKIDNEIPIILNDEFESYLIKYKEIEELHESLRLRISELIQYQNDKYALEYLEFFEKVYQKDLEVQKTNFELSITVAKYLFKLMAYKDEYEVARLYLRNNFYDELERQFGKDFKMNYHLHPPIFRSLGLNRKMKFGKWFNVAYKLLYKMRGLRGSMFDIFGFAKIRRTERKLIKEYKDIIEDLLTKLDNENYETIVQIASLPDLIRGYEHVKESHLETYYQKLHEYKTKIS
jgi:indolepyruvate ferredoxin oxidoreductase